MAQGEKRPVVMEAAKGVPGGVASLGADGKVPQEQLPEFGISNAEIKQELVDDDCLAITDSEANNSTKRVFWSDIKELLGGLFVPITRKINNKALSSDVSLNAADVGAANRNFLELSRYGTNSTGYTGWIEVGKIPIVTSSNSTQSIVFLVLGNQSTKNGVLSLLIRIEPKATISATLSNLEWLSVSDADLVDKFALASEEGYAVLYAKVTRSWDFFHVGILGQAFDTNEFMDPSDSRLFKLTSNWNLEGNHKGTINPILTSSIGFTPEIMGAVAASGWVNGRLFVGSSSGGITQLGFPSSANSILRQSTSGGPYWTTPANFVKETAVISGTDYTTVRLRGSGLRNADTNPTDNGTINWTYG